MNNGWDGWSCRGVKLVFHYWLNYQLGAPSDARRHEIAWHFFYLRTLPLAISSATFHSKEDSKSLWKSFWSNSRICQAVCCVKVDRCPGHRASWKDGCEKTQTVDKCAIKWLLVSVLFWNRYSNIWGWMFVHIHTPTHCDAHTHLQCTLAHVQVLVKIQI